MTIYPHEKALWVGTGCFIGSISEFRAAVKKTHGENRHAKEYEAALAYAEIKFSIGEKP